MDIQQKEINSYAREIVIDLSWDEIKDDFESAIKEFSKKVKLPGFRPGKVPRKVLMKQFQPAIEADFVENSVNTYYLKAVQEKGMVPVNMGNVSDVHFHHGEHFKFKVAFEVEPEVTIPKMKNKSLKVEKTIYITDDEDIDMAIDEMRQGHAEVKTVEDGAKLDDFVIGDLQEIDATGVPIIGKKLETRYLKVGQVPFDGENQKILDGIKPGDKCQVTVPIDEKGATATFELSVQNVERQVLPEVNDDFIKSADPEAKDMSDFRERVKERLSKAYEQRSDKAFDDHLTDAMINHVNPEFPPSMAESYLGHMVEDVMKSNPGATDKEKIKEMYQPVAERNLKWYLIRNTIIKNEAYEITSEDVKADIDQRKEDNPNEAKELEKYFKKPSNRSRLEDDLMEKKLLAYLNNFTKIKEVKVNTKDLRKQSEGMHNHEA
ncbi:MAG: trigger factor [Candidatus Marinimicrobia bacterium]|nr:trigger factor [Candidatus Neomarinimicrobiota bacterium]MBT3947669.1 trigger factor [Candidatus Neomarinimicrobiota bacterium]MBT4065326.1 trigger factor [Candidatus Neomarinimicrobiota bacterium]MBT4308037.1 trigger factor [Candidatus Neomarinimicrobiota bacterium]MBT4453080.1 trigger factor [Candidatus Neomarinimicrobiota bacterium]